jgi:hypothetical protein
MAVYQMPLAEIVLDFYDRLKTLTRGYGSLEYRLIGFRPGDLVKLDILLNGEPVYLRGALHWGYYPERIVPRPSREEIRRELTELRAMGCNAVKFCLWVPRAEYFDLCDETGMLAWLELPLWLPRATAELEPRMRREYPRIVERAAEHPCRWQSAGDSRANAKGRAQSGLADVSGMLRTDCASSWKERYDLAIKALLGGSLPDPGTGLPRTAEADHG